MIFASFIANMTRAPARILLIPSFVLSLSLLLSSCGGNGKASGRGMNAVVSVREQRMGIYKEGKLIKKYRISTSKFGVGDRPGSNCTPLGKHEVVAKIGHGLPSGAVLKRRHWSGEVVKPNAPGRDPIVGRILWLNGLESSNRNAYGRFIYIHGTAEESRLGSAASYGCVRMAAKDVVALFSQLSIGSKVDIVLSSLPRKVGASAPVPTTPAPVIRPTPPLPLVPAQGPAANIAAAPRRSVPVAVATRSQSYDAPSTAAENTPPPPTQRVASTRSQVGPGVVLHTRGYSPGQSGRVDY
jgi:hypothetical protein